MLRRLLVASVLGGAIVLALALPAVAQPAVAQPSRGDPVDLGAYSEPLRFIPRGDTTFTFGGTRYAGTIEVRMAPNGDLVVIDDLPFDTYVEGLNEVPARWPMETLKAQAIVARTYAWYQVRLGTFQRAGLAYDICPTVACQVFSGRAVVETPEVGHRWARAVRETAGQVLLHDGDPILARFFSTSGGHTFDNEDVFGREGPRPYLKGRPDPDDAASPLHKWQARFTRAEFDRLLSRGKTLRAVTPIRSVERIHNAGSTPDVIRVTGENGVTREVTAGALRDFLSDTAPGLDADRFPGPTMDGSRRLPSTVPSGRYEVIVTDEEVILDGSGWGHGVGMGQYGAKAKAERGLTAAEIVAFYYNGLRPTRTADLPERIRVGLVRDASVATISADGPFRVTAGRSVIAKRALGTWRVERRRDRSMGLSAPAGYGAPLVVAPTEASRSTPTPVERVTVETVVNKTTQMVLEVTGPGGDPVLERPLGVVAAGRISATWSLDDGSGEPVRSGKHSVRLVAADEAGERGGTAVPVTIRPVGSDGGEPTTLLRVRETVRPGIDPLVPALAAGGALLGLAVGLLATRRR